MTTNSNWLHCQNWKNQTWLIWFSVVETDQNPLYYTPHKNTSFKYYRYVEDDSYFQFIWHHIDFMTEFRSVICFHIHWPKICLSLELCHQISSIPPATDVTVSDVNGICLRLGITFLWAEDGRRLGRVFSHQLQQCRKKTNIKR